MPVTTQEFVQQVEAAGAVSTPQPESNVAVNTPAPASSAVVIEQGGEEDMPDLVDDGPDSDDETIE